MSSPNLPQALIESLENSQCVAWCGAGISLGAGLPAWRQLANEFIEACQEHGLSDAERDELNEMAGVGALDDVIDFCRGFLGEPEYRDFLSRVFTANEKPSDLHRMLIELPFVATYTTNYDRLLEAAFVQTKGSLPTILTNHDVTPLWRHLGRREPFILKVHGDITRPDTVVLSARDYTQHIFGNLPFMQFLQRTLMSVSILFLGTSLTDVYLRRILEESAFLSSGVGMQHYALMGPVGPIRRRILRERFNVSVISVDDYASIGEVLDLLHQRVAVT